MHDVFISYSSKDSAITEAVRGFLEANGISCWMAPGSIPNGSNYTKEIPKAIRECRIFVLILTDHAQKSIYVPMELDLAVKYEKKIMPFVLENIQLSDEFDFLLTLVQHSNTHQDKAKAMQTLADDIHTFLGKEQQVKTENIIRNTYLQNIQCPICKAHQAIQCKQLSILVDKQEKRSFGAAPIIGGIVGYVVPAVVIGSLVSSGIDVPWYMMIFLVLGGMLGVYLGICSIEAPLRRQRVLRGLHPYPFKCEKCESLFLTNEENAEI